MFQRILVPLDGSERAEQAIPLAARLARAFGGTLFLTRAVIRSARFGSTLQPPLSISSNSRCRSRPTSWM